MKVALLDSYDEARVRFLQDHIDPSWEVALSAHTAPAPELTAALIDADAVITQYWSPSTPPAPKLRLLQLPGAGYDAIDFDAVPSGCEVCNVFEHEIGIAEYIVAGILEWEIKLARMNANLREGYWRDGFVSGAPFHGEVFGKSIGFIGYGHIAREAARRLHPFGAELWTRTRSPDKADAFIDNAGGMDDLEAMLEACRYVVVTCPLTDETRGLIGARELDSLGPQGVVINVARGPVIDEVALFDALASARIEGAIIDTWYNYPDVNAGTAHYNRPSSKPFERLDNVIMSSHASGWTDALFPRRFRMIARNLECLRSEEALLNRLSPSR